MTTSPRPMLDQNWWAVCVDRQLEEALAHGLDPKTAIRYAETPGCL